MVPVSRQEYLAAAEEAGEGTELNAILEKLYRLTAAPDLRAALEDQKG